ncbi:IclR family transcriptional regulator [Bhargavaea ginsengi]|uniref:IclR family transcriptional regulator n=1 Tax=Bhargavaea ginsengi TaxID=426757 RepID=UPI003C76569D
MSSIKKVLQILDLFTADKPIWTAEEVIQFFGLSQPTGYRYLRELTHAGLLVSDNGQYSIGPKIIKLDCHIRQTDPVISAGIPVMKHLCSLTQCEVLLSNIYNDEVLIAHIETPEGHPSNVIYERGQPHPLFYGSTSKAMIAFLPRAHIARLYESYADDIREADMGNTFEEFKSNLAAIRKQGYYLSHGELDDGVTGIAAPVFKNNTLKGSLSLVYKTSMHEIYNAEKLIELTIRAAQDISEFCSTEEQTMNFKLQELERSGIHD